MRNISSFRFSTDHIVNKKLFILCLSSADFSLYHPTPTVSQIIKLNSVPFFREGSSIRAVDKGHYVTHTAVTWRQTATRWLRRPRLEWRWFSLLSDPFHARIAKVKGRFKSQWVEAGEREGCAIKTVDIKRFCVWSRFHDFDFVSLWHTPSHKINSKVQTRGRRWSNMFTMTTQPIRLQVCIFSPQSG